MQRGACRCAYNFTMTMNEVFAHVEPGLMPVLEELRSMEPIFHCAGFGLTKTEQESHTAPDFWEVGASGRRYSRDFILRALAEQPQIDGAAMGWKASDFGLRRLGPDTFLLTYTLRQTDRLTRRVTLWQSHSEGWRVLYHQGTIITSEDDNSLPG